MTKISQNSKITKIFSEAFSRIQPNTRKEIIFTKIIYIEKNFTVENNLQRNKRSLRLILPLAFDARSTKNISKFIISQFFLIWDPLFHF